MYSVMTFCGNYRMFREEFSSLRKKASQANTSQTRYLTAGRKSFACLELARHPVLLEAISHPSPQVTVCTTP